MWYPLPAKSIHCCRCEKSLMITGVNSKKMVNKWLMRLILHLEKSVFSNICLTKGLIRSFLLFKCTSIHIRSKTWTNPYKIAVPSIILPVKVIWLLTPTWQMWQYSDCLVLPLNQCNYCFLGFLNYFTNRSSESSESDRLIFWITKFQGH